jgi:Spy/CpxP family protein refolding chaperone
MDDDFMTGGVMTALRCSMLVPSSSRIVLKSLACVMCFAVFLVVLLMQPFVTLAAGSHDMPASFEQTMSKMKERLNLTEEQEAKIRPIVQESMKERGEILKSSQADRETIKKELKDIQWSTDVQIGMILTEKQKKDYQKMREEEERDKTSDEMQHSRGSHSGLSRGF